MIEAVDLDVTVEPTAPRSQDLPDVPRPMISAELAAELRDAVGPDNLVTTDDDRIVHTYGKSVRDLLRLRAGDIPRVPDVVVYPGSEEEVQLVVDRAVAANAVLIPFGGGSNISGSLHAPPDETRPVISVDMGRMNRVLSIDEESGLASQAGVLVRTWRSSGAPALDLVPLPGQLHPQNLAAVATLFLRISPTSTRHQRDHPRRPLVAAEAGSSGQPSTSTGPVCGDGPRLRVPLASSPRSRAGHRSLERLSAATCSAWEPPAAMHEISTATPLRVTPGLRRAGDPLLLRTRKIGQALDHSLVSRA